MIYFTWYLVRPNIRKEVIMNFDAIVAPSVKELFVQEIEDRILSGRLAIGDKLPTERELSEQMQISRTVINTGISEMAKKGFLQVIPRKGTFVADYTRIGTLETLTSIMKYNGGRIDDKNYRSILEIRIGIEVPSAEKAAENRTDKDIENFKSILDKLSVTEDLQQAALLLFEFHHSVCIVSGNTIAPLIFNAFKTPTLVFWEKHCRQYGIKETCNDLIEFLGYIEQKDSEKAGKYIFNNVNNALKEL